MAVRLLGGVGSVSWALREAVRSSGTRRPYRGLVTHQDETGPAAGPGSVAPFGARVNAFLLDCLAAALVAAAFTAPDLPRNWSLVSFAVLYVGGTALAGQTLGMRLLGLRLARVDRPGRIGPVAAVVRTALVMLVIPALLRDADGRGWHDRLTRTAVIRT